MKRKILAVVATLALAGPAGAVPWDLSFEADPSDSSLANLMPIKIRNHKVEVRTRAATELEWGSGTDDDGRLRPGAARAFEVTDCTAIVARDSGGTLTGANDVGRLCIDTDDNSVWHYNSSGTWTATANLAIPSGGFATDRESGICTGTSSDCTGGSCDSGAITITNDPDTYTWLDFMDGSSACSGTLPTLEAVVTCPDITGVTWDIEVTAQAHVYFDGTSAPNAYAFFRIVEDGTGVPDTWSGTQIVYNLQISSSRRVVDLHYVKSGAAASTAFTYTLEAAFDDSSAGAIVTNSDTYAQITAECIQAQ